MIELGKYNTLKIVRQSPIGLYLDGREEGEILLPNHDVPADYQIGDKLKVFLYLDNQERLVATTQAPLTQVNEFAYLEVGWVNRYGAFLKWGPQKDLFVPFSEQKKRMEVGKSYIVYTYIDEASFRIVASAKVDKFLSKERPPYRNGQEVDILIWQKTELGFKAIVDNRFGGLIYDNEVFGRLHTGVATKAYIKQVRDDNKIDLIMQKPGKEKVGDFADTLLEFIRHNGGKTLLNDNSDPAEIRELFGVSKKTFKKAIGDLYKRHLILVHENGLELVTKT